jgi:hypothetical protein
MKNMSRRMTKNLKPLSGMALLGLLLLGLGGCGGCAPDIPFADYKDDFRTKPDFARIEHRFPLTRALRAELTPRNLERFDQEQIDQIYARLTAGPIPDGPYQGTFFFAEGGGVDRLSEILGGLKGALAELEGKKIELLGQALWKGKVFYRDQRLLRNMIQAESVVADLFDVEVDRLRREEIGGREVALLFPARLYCGQSLLDSRRESVIIDYAFTDEIDGYVDEIDFLAGRNGLQVRDEIRRVRPGFYLGRAYLGRIFVLNFTLLNPEVEAGGREAFLAGDEMAEDCWNGGLPGEGSDGEPSQVASLGP